MSTARYLLAWLPMVAIAIVNGTLRDFTYGRLMSNGLAHQLSTFTLIAAFVVYVWLLHRKWPLESASQALVVGAVWLVLTVLFEFGMGRFISHLSWERMLQAYNLFAGELWILVPLAVGVLPYAVYKAA